MEQVGQVEQKTHENLSTSSKYAGDEAPPLSRVKPGPYEGLAAAMAAELMIGFWFGIGVVLAVKTLGSLECPEENTNKMEEENQQQEPQQEPKEPQ